MTTLSISKEELTKLDPCDLNTRLRMFGRSKTLSVELALKKGASIRDILWVATRVGRKDLCIKFALLVAQRVEHLDKSGKAKACNDALSSYILDPSPKNLTLLKTARAYAVYADAAVYAAYAVYAAADADAAYAAYAAADAAAVYAAYAVYAAADADAAAVRKIEIEEQKKILIRVFATENV